MGYEYTYTTNTYDTATTGGIFAALGAYMFIYVIVGVLMLVSMWKIFTKAGKPGWAAIVPIYNIIVLLQIVELPLWYIVLFFIPIANIYAMFKIYIELAHKFGKSTGFGVLTVFFSVICMPILAFSKDAVYKGTTDSQTSPVSQPTMTPVEPTMTTTVTPEQTVTGVQEQSDSNQPQPPVSQ